jgi:mannose-6-phosphate isomerase-like protein (cupin superfamily)/quercetin dioxygenase-like cupin family protein
MNAPPPNVKDLRDHAPLDEAIEILNDVLSSEPVPAAPTVRGRLLGRVADSAARHQGLITVRTHRLPVQTPGEGVSVRWVYAADATRPRRAGEPQRVALIELQPGARLTSGLDLAHRHSEWLIVSGSATVDDVALDALDHHGHAASRCEPVLASAGGAMVYLRDNGSEPSPAGTSRERHAQWEKFAPGIRRRLLWQAGNACAYLARAQAGAAVPAHGHRNDEECLMIEGEIFTGDILIREGEFQLAPAGLAHGLVQAATACVVYLRADAELDILPGY